MKKFCVIIIKLIGALIGAAAGVFALLQAVYWLNLDNKALFLLQKVLNKITDRVPRDRRF